MKLTIVANTFPPEKGAAPSRFYKLATDLQQRGVDVEVIAGLPNYPTGRFFKGYRWRWRKIEMQGGIKTRRYWLYPTNSSSPIPRILNMFSFSFSLLTIIPYLRFRRKPDLLMVNTPPLFTGWTGILIGRLAGAVTVANVSDVWPLTALEMGAMKKGRMYALLQKVEHAIYRRSHVWVAQSEESLVHINKEAKEQKPQFLYRNLDKPSPFLEQGIAFDPARIKIVYAGLLGIAQGVLQICSNISFKELGMEFHIYGSGAELEAIKNHIDQHPGCNIFLHEPIPKEAVPEMLAGYHATIVPLSTSIYGAFPSKVFMAIASGLPVFFSGNGEGRAVVERYGIGWTNDPGNMEQLRHNIASLKTMSVEHYEKVRRNCIDACRNEFDFEAQNERFYAFLLSAAKAGK